MVGRDRSSVPMPPPAQPRRQCASNGVYDLGVPAPELVRLPVKADTGALISDTALLGANCMAEGTQVGYDA